MSSKQKAITFSLRHKFMSDSEVLQLKQAYKLLHDPARKNESWLKLRQILGDETEEEFVNSTLKWGRFHDKIFQESGIETHEGLPKTRKDAEIAFDYWVKISLAIDPSCPIEGLRNAIINYVWNANYKWEDLSKQRKKSSHLERKKEDELYYWLVHQGVKVERQVKTSYNHRLDLWIPGKLMLELKAGRVTGDDVCQAIDYYATYKRPILLVGSGMSSAASRGIESFNKLFQDTIVFVTWSGVKNYLQSTLRN
jgi:hypothetical protein